MGEAMDSVCILEAEGLQISFAMTVLQTKKGDLTAKKYVDLVVRVRLDSHLKELSMESVPTITAIADLYKLTQYLEQHIVKLQENPDEESWTFMPIGGFQIQALAGNVLSESDGEFTLRCMVNVGRSSNEGATLYAGAEGVVTVKNTREFIASVRAALAGLHSHFSINDKS